MASTAIDRTPQDARGSRLADALYESLRGAVVRGELRPNQRLIETELAARLGVSRTPVREVLQRLAGDGLVVAERRSWLVREHTPAEIREIFECRSGLEACAARLAAARRTAEAARAISAMAHDDSLLAPDRGRRVEANDRFHQLVVAAAANRMLAELIERSRLFHFNHRLAAAYSEPEMVQSQREHAAIAEAIAGGDEDAAEEAARRHVETALAAALAKLDLIAATEPPPPQAC
ncbi:MAG: GntR family transcriptional regulator [Candidatus Dormibacteraeota bacterium]|nr:GntR family transcriptional regulator [Candidatus Dormibacteraeota bacterium]